MVNNLPALIPSPLSPSLSLSLSLLCAREAHSHTTGPVTSSICPVLAAMTRGFFRTNEPLSRDDVEYVSEQFVSFCTAARVLCASVSVHVYGHPPGITYGHHMWPSDESVQRAQGQVRVTPTIIETVFILLRELIQPAFNCN